MTQFHMLCLHTSVISIQVPSIMVTLAGLIFHLSIIRIGAIAAAPTLLYTGWIGVSQLQTLLTEEWIELHCVYVVFTSK